MKKIIIPLFIFSTLNTFGQNDSSNKVANDSINRTNIDKTEIADEVLDQIAIQAANDVYGVYEGNSDEGFIQSLQAKTTKTSIRNVSGNLVIDLDLSLDKSVNVRKTVKKIQENVKNVVETMTGINVSRVNININKLEI